MPINFIVYGLGILLALSFAGNIKQAFVSATDRIEIADLKRAASDARADGERLVAHEAKHAMQLSAALLNVRELQEKTNAEHKQLVAGLRNEIRAAGRRAGGPGLRDPNAPAAPANVVASAPVPAAGIVDGGGHAAAAPGLVSQPLEDLLFELVDEGDRINTAYIACRSESRALRVKFNAWREAP